ncbi:hypothetical protein [Sphingobium yanoikuyae]|uniref:Integrase n=1 Tax=Sphingobium yanoikuyae TaxID=13690 RepID=A0A430BBY8_SPHYA|nr:hypothetical protein [Sphingobium yanoikuyae]RSU45973.1 hypothetical protein DAH51_26565 [Sphingobium yanoikuyae]
MLRAITDYLIESENKAGLRSAKNRLGHVIEHIALTGAGVKVAQIDRKWVDGFRSAMAAKLTPKGTKRSLSHIEGCVLQLIAVINSTPGERASFKAEQQKEVSNSPTYRADIATMAKMFEYCLRPAGGRSDKERLMIAANRAPLLRYLRLAVATWARPDAIYDVRPDQWHSAARVLNLNPIGRRQTKKFRPTVPIPHQLAPWLDDMGEQWLAVSTIKYAWGKMAKHIGLPGNAQAGEKLIRRSVSTIVRKRIGEEHWRQGEMMLGHVKMSISDIYAVPDPANLGLALAATESIIDEIEKLAPGAFARPKVMLRAVK